MEKSYWLVIWTGDTDEFFTRGFAYAVERDERFADPVMRQKYGTESVYDNDGELSFVEPDERELCQVSQFEWYRARKKPFASAYLFLTNSIPLPSGV